MNTETGKCKCGCGESVPVYAGYVPGYDLIHRAKLIDNAGGVDKLSELLKLVDAYIVGEIGESELAKGVRRIQVR